MTEGTRTTGNRVAIVTGAARGIGAATAVRLAREGFAVAVCDLDEAACAGTVAEIEKDGGRALAALAVGVDVADADRVAAAVARVADELGPPVVLVNNAGITRDNLLFKMTDDDWDSVMAVHLRGSFLMTRAAREHMTAAGWGRIVNLSSVSALGNRGQVNYSAAKAGLQGFTKTLAIELDGRVPGQRRRVVRVRPGDLRRRRPARLTVSRRGLRRAAATGRPGPPPGTARTR